VTIQSCISNGKKLLFRPHYIFWNNGYVFSNRNCFNRVILHRSSGRSSLKTERRAFDANFSVHGGEQVSPNNESSGFDPFLGDEWGLALYDVVSNGTAHCGIIINISANCYKAYYNKGVNFSDFWQVYSYMPKMLQGILESYTFSKK